MSTDNISETKLETAPDTQLDNFPSIGDAQLDEIISDAKAISMDMPELASSSTTTLTQRRRERVNEREQKLHRNARRFYHAYFIGVAVVLCALVVLMIPLHNWLVRFESTQPDQYSQHIYETLFAQPDWAAIYDMSKMGDDDFSGRDAYVRYMQAKVDAATDKKITYYETSAGLSSDHKYLVALDGKKIATFILSGSVNPKTNKTEWEMTDLQLVTERNQNVTVQRLPGHTVLINGKEAGDDYIVRNIYTKAEDYLPEGVHGLSIQELYIDGLMANPTVEVLDTDGNPVPTVFDAVTNSYSPDMTDFLTMTDAEREVILGAARANGLFAIRAIGTGDLRKYFDPGTQIYKDICSTPTFIQSFASYSFKESATKISDFYRYNENIFSARVTLQLDITRKNGTVKSLDMNTTYIFTKNAAGVFMVSNITNVDLQEKTQQVRLRFDCNGTILDTMMVEDTAKTIITPLPTVPAGQEFVGWATRTVAEDGQITMNILFTPDKSGKVQVSTELEPMTLYAVFYTEEAEQ